MPAAVGLLIPVPPPAAVRMPEVVALKVKELPVLVIYMPVVRPLLVEPVEVPSQILPIWPVPYVWAMVREVVADNIPKLEVAYAVYPPEALPRRSEEEAIEVRPVPP